MSIHLCVVYGYFNATTAELSGCHRDHIANKPKTIWLFTEKTCKHLIYLTKNKVKNILQYMEQSMKTRYVNWYV